MSLFMVYDESVVTETSGSCTTFKPVKVLANRPTAFQVSIYGIMELATEGEIGPGDDVWLVVARTSQGDDDHCDSGMWEVVGLYPTEEQANAAKAREMDKALDEDESLDDVEIHKFQVQW